MKEQLECKAINFKIPEEANVGAAMQVGRTTEQLYAKSYWRWGISSNSRDSEQTAAVAATVTQLVMVEK